jgi:hypothetical protein
VSKVRDSRYQSGRSNDWARKMCAQAPDAANLRFYAEEVRRHLSRLAEHHNMIGNASATTAVKDWLCHRDTTTIQIGSSSSIVATEPIDHWLSPNGSARSTATKEREPAATLADPDLNGLRHGTSLAKIDGRHGAPGCKSQASVDHSCR